MNKTIIIIMLASFMGMGCLNAYAQATSKAPATFSVVRGKVSLKKSHRDEAPIPAVIGMEAYFGDLIRTQNRSRAQLKFIDGSVVNLSSNYHIEIKDFSYNAEKKVRKSIIRSMRGTLRAIVSKIDTNQSSFVIETPSAMASVRGTDFYVIVGPDNITDIVVIEGSVAVRNIDPSVAGEVLVFASQMTRVEHGKAPIKPRHVAAENLKVLMNRSDPHTKTLNKHDRTEKAPVVAPIGTPDSANNYSGDDLFAMSRDEHETKKDHRKSNREGKRKDDREGRKASKKTSHDLSANIPLNVKGNLTTPLPNLGSAPIITPPVTSGAISPTSNTTIQLLFP